MSEQIYFDNNIDMCIFTNGGQDQVILHGTGADFIVSGGIGGDQINPREGNTIIIYNYEGAGGDAQYFKSGNEVHGGSGSDHLACLYCEGDVKVFGGKGNDDISTGAGNDYIVPGPGQDIVDAGSGDDSVMIYNECELESGEFLNGGAGNDILYLPISLTEAQSKGITITNFETIILTSDYMAGYAECAFIDTDEGTAYEHWDSAAYYTDGTIVNYNDELWICLLTHQANETWTPDVATAIWDKI
jgi:Ca2+-binding RTX toxin-like protein